MKKPILVYLKNTLSDMGNELKMSGKYKVLLVIITALKFDFKKTVESAKRRKILQRERERTSPTIPSRKAKADTNENKIQLSAYLLTQKRRKTRRPLNLRTAMRDSSEIGRK